MRDARTNDIWRELFRRQTIGVMSLSIDYNSIPGLGTGTIFIEGPIALLCGVNGAGKSKALITVLRSLSPAPIGFYPPLAPQRGSITQITLKYRDGSGSGNLQEHTVVGTEAVEAYLNGTDDGLRVAMFDPTVQVPFLIRTIRDDSNFADLYDGIDPIVLDEKQRAELSYIVGRDYSKIYIYEIPDYKDQEVTPYFICECDGAAYGAEEMGTGELALLFLYWVLLHIKPGSILLMEEPESFVANRSQRALIDLVAAHALEGRLFVVLTSHSSQLAARVPPSNRTLLSRANGALATLKNPPNQLLAEQLGLIPHYHVVLVVEDESARCFVAAFLESTNASFSTACDIIIANGEGNLTDILRKLPRDSRNKAKIVGVYDGDQSDRLPADLVWPKLCLPGATDPDALARTFMLNAGAERLGKLLNRDAAVITAALASVAGIDHHDWIARFAAVLHLEVQEIYRQIMPAWITDNHPEAERLKGKFEGAMRS